MSNQELAVPGAEYHPSVIHPDIAMLTFQPGMDIASYASRVIATNMRLSLNPNSVSGVQFNSPLRYVPNFVGTVNQGTKVLLKEATPELVEDARQSLIEYTQQLKEASAETNTRLGDTRYLPWILKVRELSGFSRVRNPEKSSENDEAQYDAENFWADIYMGTVYERSAQQAYETYILGPNIEGKDPSILSYVIDRIHNEGLSEVFANTSNLGNTDKLGRMAYDNFVRVIDEAATAGWKNAVLMKARLGKIRTKDEPLYGVLNRLGNEATALINRFALSPGQTPLRKLQVYNIADSPEAVNRCSYLIFELGKPPEGHDSINYELTAQLDSLFLTQATKLLAANRTP